MAWMDASRQQQQQQQQSAVSLAVETQVHDSNLSPQSSENLVSHVCQSHRASGNTKRT